MPELTCKIFRHCMRLTVGTSMIEAEVNTVDLLHHREHCEECKRWMKEGKPADLPFKAGGIEMMTKEKLNEVSNWLDMANNRCCCLQPNDYALLAMLLAEVERLQAIEAEVESLRDWVSRHEFADNAEEARKWRSRPVSASGNDPEISRIVDQTIENVSRVAEEPALKKIRQARTRGHGERPGG